MAHLREEKYAPRALLVEMGGFTGTELVTFMRNNDIEASSTGIPVFALIKALNKARKRRGHKVEVEEVDQLLKHEKLQETRIKNQERLGKLIEKTSAKERVRKAFTTVAARMRHQIKQTAVKLATVPNARDCETIMTNDYNTVLDDLLQEADNVTWEEDGQRTQLERTEINGSDS